MLELLIVAQLGPKKISRLLGHIQDGRLRREHAVETQLWQESP